MQHTTWQLLVAWQGVRPTGFSAPQRKREAADESIHEISKSRWHGLPDKNNSLENVVLGALSKPVHGL